MTSQLDIELKADLPELDRLNDAVEAFGETQIWTPQVLFKVRLALEELVINVMTHGNEGLEASANTPPPRILVTLVQKGTQLSVVVADTGVAFNPLQKPPPDLTSCVEDRPIGGLGVHLVAQLMDRVAYQRDGEWNRVTLTKDLRG